MLKTLLPRAAVRDTALILLVTSAGIGIAAPEPALAQKKPAAKKPAAKKPPVKKAGSTGAVVLGTKQLPGDFGKIGTTYTIGTRSPLNFTLKSAEYSVAPVNLANQVYYPSAEQKLLVLRYSIQNPNPRETGYSWTGMSFTAVDSKDVNHSALNGISRAGDSAPLDISLKPAQKIDVFTAILVPADGVVPKLIVERESGAPVIRYDLRGKATPLPAPYADPADTSGATPVKEIAATVGGAYQPHARFDVKLDDVKYSTSAVGSVTPAAGNRLVVATFSIRNRSTGPLSYSWTTFGSFLRDADNEKEDAKSTVLKGARDEPAAGELAAGEETRLRFLYEIPEKVAVKSIAIAEDYGKPRPVVFTVPAAP